MDCWGKKSFRAKWKEELTTNQKGIKYLLTVSAQETVNVLTTWINLWVSGSHLKPEHSPGIRQVQKLLLQRI